MGESSAVGWKIRGGNRNETFRRFKWTQLLIQLKQAQAALKGSKTVKKEMTGVNTVVKKEG